MSSCFPANSCLGDWGGRLICSLARGVSDLQIQFCQMPSAVFGVLFIVLFCVIYNSDSVFTHANITCYKSVELKQGNIFFFSRHCLLLTNFVLLKGVKKLQRPYNLQEELV